MRTSKPLAIFLILLTVIFMLSGAIAVPLLCRPFYYAHIESMDLPLRLGLNAEQIRTAYDQVMDYCLGITDHMAAGVFPFSQEGAAHFADVRELFRLDLVLFALSLAALLATFIASRRCQVRPYCFRGRGPGFWAAVGTGTALLVVGGLSVLDFEQAFEVFHLLLFPGEDNWLFSIYEDPVILILPETFFMNCALLILGLLLTWCAILVAADLWAGKRRREQKAEALLPPCQRRPKR